MITKHCFFFSLKSLNSIHSYKARKHLRRMRQIVHVQMGKQSEFMLFSAANYLPQLIIYDSMSWNKNSDWALFDGNCRCTCIISFSKFGVVVLAETVCSRVLCLGVGACVSIWPVYKHNGSFIAIWIRAKVRSTAYECAKASSPPIHAENVLNNHTHSLHFISSTTFSHELTLNPQESTTIRLIGI